MRRLTLRVVFSTGLLYTEGEERRGIRLRGEKRGGGGGTTIMKEKNDGQKKEYEKAWVLMQCGVGILKALRKGHIKYNWVSSLGIEQEGSNRERGTVRGGQISKTAGYSFHKRIENIEGAELRKKKKIPRGKKEKPKGKERVRGEVRSGRNQLGSYQFSTGEQAAAKTWQGKKGDVCGE